MSFESPQGKHSSHVKLSKPSTIVPTGSFHDGRAISFQRPGATHHLQWLLLFGVLEFLLIPSLLCKLKLPLVGTGTSS